MSNKFLMIVMATLMATLTACGPQSRRAKIEQRRAALQHRQDSTLAASQAELAWVDSALQAANERYEQLLDRLHSGSHTKGELERLGSELTVARLHRDSLQVRFEVLCGKIKYVHRKQKEREQNGAAPPAPEPQQGR